MTTTSTKTMKKKGKQQQYIMAVPFFVETPDDTKKNEAKAIFEVPSDLANQLVKQPILCRGSCFDLAVDTVADDKTYICTHYYTAQDPQATALEIAKRLSNRIGDPDASQALSSMVFGGGSSRSSK